MPGATHGHTTASDNHTRGPTTLAVIWPRGSDYAGAGKTRNTQEDQPDPWRPDGLTRASAEVSDLEPIRKHLLVGAEGLEPPTFAL